MQFFSFVRDNSFPLMAMPEDKLDVNIFLNTSDNGTILDVRSPSEFAKGHIPDA